MSHLYNLRKSTTYSRQRRHFEKTRPQRSSIGERRKPQPNGQPGYIRIDMPTAWASFEDDGRIFWTKMDSLVEMLDGVVAEEANDA